MKQVPLVSLLGSAVLSVIAAGAALATPLVNGATIETRTFNDCPLSTVTTSNNYPASIEITDEMHPACVGFANLHSFSLSEDGGATAAVFDNNSNFRFAADFVITGAGEGEGGLRISPWYGQFIDGRFMINATTGEIACFGGALPFYSFTVNHGIKYVKGTTIHLEMTYEAHDLTSANPATIQYQVVYGGITYDSPVLPFGQQNPAECNPYGLYGMLNDGRVGGYFQPRANTGASLTATWSNIEFSCLPADGTPVVDGATIEARTFNDCPLSTLTTSNNFPASIEITDEMHPACVGFANLHSFSLSEDGGATAAVFDNNSNFRFAADFVIAGPGEGDGGLRISPWYGQFIDGRFMINATTGEIACFGGALPFYSFTVNHGINYVKGTTIHLEMTYEAHDLTATDPATAQYRVVYNGSTYDSPVLPFGQQNPAECDPYGLYGMLNDGRVGGYLQPRANTGASLTATWTKIEYSILDDCPCGVDTTPPTIDVTLSRDTLWPPNHKLVEICATVDVADDCDPTPAVTLLSITSDEPDNGLGDGDTANDIQFGTESNCFYLRSERQGGGDGRVYTITYCATDAAGNEACAADEVSVPHDQSGSAFASLGFSADGTRIQHGANEYALVIRSSATFSAGNVNPARTFVGNESGLAAPTRWEVTNMDGDGLPDLRVFYSAGSRILVLREEPTDFSPVGLRYETYAGVGYLVPDIFGLGPPLESLTGVPTSGDVRGVVSPAQPNPFTNSTQIRYVIGGGAGGRVEMVVYDGAGRRVRTLFSGTRTPGSYVAVWDGRSDDGGRAAAGVYFLRADVGGRDSVERLILLR